MNHINENQDGEDFGNREERLLVEREIAQDEAARIESENWSAQAEIAAERRNERALEDRGEGENDLHNHTPAPAPQVHAAAPIRRPVPVTFTKLQDGSWGIRGAGAAPAVGTQVTVSKKDGSTSTAIVASILSSKDGYWVASIRPTPRPSAPVAFARSYGRRFTCEDCGDKVSSGTRCWETGLQH